MKKTIIKSVNRHRYAFKGSCGMIIILFSLFLVAGSVRAETQNIQKLRNSLRDIVYRHHVLMEKKGAEKEYSDFISRIKEVIKKKGTTKALEELLVGAEKNLAECQGRIQSENQENSSQIKSEIKGSSDKRKRIKRRVKRQSARHGDPVSISSDSDNLVTMSVKDMNAARILDNISQNRSMQIIYPESFKTFPLSIKVRKISTEKVFSMIAQLTGTSLIISDESIVFQEQKTENVKKEHTFYVINTSYTDIDEKLIKKLSSRSYTLLDISEVKPGCFNIRTLITETEKLKMNKLIQKLHPKVYEVNFRLYELNGENKTLISQPRLLTSDAQKARIDIESNDKENLFSLFIETRITKKTAEKDLYNVEIQMSINITKKDIESRLKSASSFNTSGSYTYSIFDNNGVERYCLEMQINKK